MLTGFVFATQPIYNTETQCIARCCITFIIHTPVNKNKYGILDFQQYEKY